MSSVSYIAMSGMNAAVLRLGAAASNIANARSNGPLPTAPNATSYRPVYTPREVVQTALPGGGVEARIVPSSSKPLAVYDPAAPYADAGGMVASPDIDIGHEVVNALQARNSFIANVKVAQADQDMFDALINIKRVNVRA